jgi:hypothetical protein
MVMFIDFTPQCGFAGEKRPEPEWDFFTDIPNTKKPGS